MVFSELHVDSLSMDMLILSRTIRGRMCYVTLTLLSKSLYLVSMITGLFNEL